MDFNRDFSKNIDASIIIICKNELNRLDKTIDSMIKSKNNYSYEIILIDDGSTDGCCDFIRNNPEKYNQIRIFTGNNFGIAAGRNIGAFLSKGDYLFFFDAHIEVEDYWIDNLINDMLKFKADAITPIVLDMDDKSIMGCGATWDEYMNYQWLTNIDDNGMEVPFMPGGACVIKKSIFEEVGGFDKHYGPWGYEDQEMSLKLWLFGYKIVGDTNVKIAHLFNKSHNFEIDYSAIIYNYIWMIYSHLSTENLGKALTRYASDKLFPKVAAQAILNDDLIKQRKDYFAKRKYDDYYFLNKFKINFYDE